jgi:hypothetical protein
MQENLQPTKQSQSAAGACLKEETQLEESAENAKSYENNISSYSVSLR